MYCRTCGNKINDNTNVCVKCGCKPLAGKNYCQNCGAKTSIQQVMCTKCKSTLKSLIVTNKQSQTNGGNHTFGIVLTVLGFILLMFTIFRIAFGFISKEFIYDLIYDPEYFFSEDIKMALICLFLSIIFLVLGKRLNKGKKK